MSGNQGKKLSVCANVDYQEKSMPASDQARRLCVWGEISGVT